LVAAGLAGLSLYSLVVPDALYRAATSTHVFWHPLYDGMISSSPELQKFYSYGRNAYTDEISTYAVRADMRERNDTSSPIAYLTPGGIEIDLMRNMGAFDAAVRRLFFNVVMAHPFLVLKSFIYDKPRDQLRLLNRIQLFEINRYWSTLLLGLVAVVIYFAAGGPIPTMRQVVRAIPLVLLAAVFSSATTMVVASALIVDTIFFYVMLLSVLLIYLPVGLCVGSLMRLRDHTALHALRSRTVKWPASASASSPSIR
jgi:hypothetical protein